MTVSPPLVPSGLPLQPQGNQLPETFSPLFPRLVGESTSSVPLSASILTKSTSLFLLLKALRDLSEDSPSVPERPSGLRRVLASLSRAERTTERRSRWAAINERRSWPCTVGGMVSPELEGSRA